METVQFKNSVGFYDCPMNLYVTWLSPKLLSENGKLRFISTGFISSVLIYGLDRESFSREAQQTTTYLQRFECSSPVEQFMELEAHKLN